MFETGCGVPFSLTRKRTSEEHDADRSDQNDLRNDQSGCPVQFVKCGHGWVSTTEKSEQKQKHRSWVQSTVRGQPQLALRCSQQAAPEHRGQVLQDIGDTVNDQFHVRSDDVQSVVHGRMPMNRQRAASGNSGEELAGIHVFGVVVTVVHHDGVPEVSRRTPSERPSANTSAPKITPVVPSAEYSQLALNMPASDRNSPMNPLRPWQANTGHGDKDHADADRRKF
jgi:hypothetical protein